MIRTLALLCCLLPLATVAEANAADIEITPDVVYGHKDGLAMTFDVFRPTQDANGAGVLFMVSGGWYSNWVPPQLLASRFEPLTSQGFTVFAVRHGSSPKYGIPDAVADVRRGVRFIRANAKRFQIDPDRIGVFGMSAGGHLSLMLGTTADDGTADDNDPVLRVSDRVQAVVAFVAPTDLTIMVHDAKDRLPAYDRFPALQLEMDKAKANSPLLHVTPDDAPTLLLAGVKDDLVPIDHSRRIKKSLDDQKVACELIEYPDAGHGFGADDMKKAIGETVAWFEKHLAPK